mmetsp:Transcript_52654/g.136341  ORF Transcript_52654/g.136341 Transcript_52654/m.136341 type:complete len:246 (-) Transcript_52654:1488-2225(-)
MSNAHTPPCITGSTGLRSALSMYRSQKRIAPPMSATWVATPSALSRSHAAAPASPRLAACASVACNCVHGGASRAPRACLACSSRAGSTAASLARPSMSAIRSSADNSTLESAGSHTRSRATTVSNLPSCFCACTQMARKALAACSATLGTCSEDRTKCTAPSRSVGCSVAMSLPNEPTRRTADVRTAAGCAARAPCAMGVRSMPTSSRMALCSAARAAAAAGSLVSASRWPSAVLSSAWSARTA